MLFFHERFTGTNVYYVPLGMILGDRKHSVFWDVKWEHLRDCGRIPTEHGTLSMSALLCCSMLCKKTELLKSWKTRHSMVSHMTSQRNHNHLGLGMPSALNRDRVGSVSCSDKWEPVQDCAETPECTVPSSIALLDHPMLHGSFQGEILRS